MVVVVVAVAATANNDVGDDVIEWRDERGRWGGEFRIQQSTKKRQR
jgi:hypothetical protein